jgi:hypothetical protein
MCPACLSTVALLIAGGTSAGGLTVLVKKKLRARRNAENFSQKPNPRRTHHEQQQSGISESRIPD